MTLGPCCACRERPAIGFVMIDRRAPIPGTGWGCLVCELPLDGAMAVLCDVCGTDDAIEIRDVVRGRPGESFERELLATCTERFEHNRKMHELDDRLRAAVFN